MSDGGEYLKRMRRTLADLRQRASRASGELDGRRKRLREVVARRGDSLEKLARHYLPELSAEAVDETFVDARHDLDQLLEERSDRLEELTREIEVADLKLEEQELELDELTGRLDAKVAERDDLEAQLAERLTADTEFAELSRSAAESEEQLERNEERIAALDRESAQKLPAYEEDRLFQYLVERKFATADYASRGLIRRLDRWVAGLVDFRAAKRSYDFLRVTPLLVRQEVERRGEEFELLMKRVEEHRDNLAKELGLEAAFAEGVRLGEQRDELASKNETLHSEQEARLAERSAIEAHRGRFYAAAIVHLRQLLAESKERTLAEHAASTPSRRDDDLVRRIHEADEDLDELGDDLEEDEREAGELLRRASGLEELIGLYRSQNFDSVRSRFQGDAPKRELKDYARGFLSKAQLWEGIKRRQRFRHSSGGGGRRGSRRGPDRHSRGWPGGRRPGKPVTESVIDLVGGALRDAMARGIYRRGRKGGWQWGQGMSFPDFPSIPRFPKLPRSGGRRSSRLPRGRSRSRKRGGFSTRDGF